MTDAWCCGIILFTRPRSTHDDDEEEKEGGLAFGRRGRRGKKTSRDVLMVELPPD